jgi:hypothetical protein
MTWTAVYPWLVTLHVLSAFAFLALHGVSMGVWWRLRRERDRTKLAAWLELSISFISPMALAGSLLILSGVLAGVAGAWWFNGQWWLWLSIGALVVIVGLMTPMLAIPLGNVRRGLGIPGQADRKAGTVPAAVDDAELDRLLANRRPMVGALTAVSGIVLITWLMETKPF